eukprot:scaffold2549_cov57-Phaeocystis_antarctica.AAC.2
MGPHRATLCAPSISRDLNGRLSGPGLNDAPLAARGDCAAPLTPAAAASARRLVPGQRRDLLRLLRLRLHPLLRRLPRCQLALLEALQLMLEARAKRPTGIVAFELLCDLPLQNRDARAGPRGARSGRGRGARLGRAGRSGAGGDRSRGGSGWA